MMKRANPPTRVYGAIGLQALIVLNIGLLMTVMLFSLHGFWRRRATCQIATDAAALAGGQFLAEHPNEFAAAVNEAERYFDQNIPERKLYQPQVLLNEDHEPLLTQFRVDALPSGKGLPFAHAIAEIDRKIVGFQASSSSNIPCVPFAAISDPEDQIESSWERQVESSGEFEDKLFHLELGSIHKRDENESEQNGVWFAMPDAKDFPRQIAGGFNKHDLELQQGELKVGDTLALPGRIAASSQAIPEIHAAFSAWRSSGSPKILPLFKSDATLSQRIRISRFVAVRLKGFFGPDSSGHWKLELQPDRYDDFDSHHCTRNESR